MYLTCCARTYINYSAFPLATNKCQAGWITRWNQDCWTNSNHLRYADDTTLMAESEEELKSLLIRVKVQFRSVAQPLWDPMHCSTPGFPIHHQLPELAQTHVHHVSDAIQPSYPLLSPSLPASNLPNIRVFSNESFLRIRWPKYWSFSFSISPSNEYSGLISLGLTALIF